MDLLLLLKALLMGVVEGLTEFLPVSSTGHLIITGELIGFLDKPRRDVFTIFIQLGAILAICWAYRQRLWDVATHMRTQKSQRFVLNLFLAFLPAAILGLLFIGQIKDVLFRPLPVAIALIVGGLLILWAERRPHRITVETVDDMTWQDALKIGFAQSLALIPGTSRSGATIIGGLLFGLSRKAAAEFSFFLAIPTMFAASLYDLYKHRALLDMADLQLFVVGFVAAFAAGLLAVKALLAYVQRHDFTVFAWYRIAFGVVVLLTAQMGWVDWGSAH